MRSARVRGVVGTLIVLRRWWLVPPLHHARRYAIDGTALGVRALETLRAPLSRLEGSHAEVPAIISYTSGSTGRAKGVVRTHRVLLGQHRAIRRNAAERLAYRVNGRIGCGRSRRLCLAAKMRKLGTVPAK